MKKDKVLELLTAGHKIIMVDQMNFKRGKLQRGTTKRYKINDQQIRSSTFESLSHMLTRCDGKTILNTIEYKLKDEFFNK